MPVSPSVAVWFTLGSDVPQSSFLSWALDVENDIAALETLLASNGYVTTAKLADGAVTPIKLASNAVETANIADNAVTSAKINAKAVSNAKLADMAAATFKANNAGALGVPLDVSAADAARMLPYAAFERSNRAGPFIRNDFLLPNEAAGFAATLILTGTLAAGPNVDANHPGVVQFSSSATTNSGVAMTTGATALRLGGGEQFDCIFRTPSGAFTNVTQRFGFLDTLTSADATDGVYFEFSGSGVTVAKTANNSVRTTSATVATLLVSTWYHARITLNANATLATFEIFDDNGTLVGSTTIATNIPTAAGRETGAGFVVTFGGAAATALAQLDYMAVSLQSRAMVRGALT